MQKEGSKRIKPLFFGNDTIENCIAELIELKIELERNGYNDIYIKNYKGEIDVYGNRRSS